MASWIHETDVDWDQVDMDQVGAMLRYVDEKREYGGSCAFWNRKNEILDMFYYVAGDSAADRQHAERFIVRFLMRDLLEHARWRPDYRDTLARVNGHTKTAIAMALFDLYLRPEIADRMRHEGRDVPKFLTKWQHPWPDRSYRRCTCKPIRRP